MNEQRLRAALRAPRTECDPSDSSDAVRRTNLARLRPEIDRTAAILQKSRKRGGKISLSSHAPAPSHLRRFSLTRTGRQAARPPRGFYWAESS